MESSDPIERSLTNCGECENEADVMRDIFIYYRLPFGQIMPVCLIKGVNCDDEDLVTHIRLGMFCSKKY